VARDGQSDFPWRQLELMWRVRRPDGTLTDMLNRTRAKDAATSIAVAMLNQQRSAAAA
jgi:hypothetical protein